MEQLQKKNNTVKIIAITATIIGSIVLLVVKTAKAKPSPQPNPQPNPNPQPYPQNITIDKIPVKGPVTSKFGWRVHPITNKQQFHDGIDIATIEGTPIINLGNGKVIKTGENAISGKFMIIEHDFKAKNINSLKSKYAHLSEFIAKEGDKVKFKQVIAKTGNTGRSTGPHLHFMILINDKITDPIAFMDIYKKIVKI